MSHQLVEIKIREAFQAADQLQQSGNPQMTQVKLKLKEAAGYFSPTLTNELAGKLGVGKASAPAGGRSSFLAKADHPALHKGKAVKKNMGAAQPAADVSNEVVKAFEAAKQQAKTEPEPEKVKAVQKTETKGTITQESADPNLFEKIAGLSPVQIAKTYPDSLYDLAGILGINVNKGWNNNQLAAAIRKAAIGKVKK